MPQFTVATGLGLSDRFRRMADSLPKGKESLRDLFLWECGRGYLWLWYLRWDCCRYALGQRRWVNRVSGGDYREKPRMRSGQP